MKRVEMIERIDAELARIPRGAKGSPQNAFRMLYNVHRRRDLKRNPETPSARSLLRTIASTTREYPYFSPSFDHKRFGM